MRTLLILSICLLPFSAIATIWQVGPGFTFTAPSQVSTLVGDGDTVDIAAGNYPSDVALWTANDLMLRGVGGLADLESNGLAWGGKAIWVVQGDRTTVERIGFRECSVPDNNGAGIRQEGHHLTVRHCLFQDNENGILAGEVHPSTIRIEHSEFAYNGYGDGYSHNLYIGNVDSLIFRYNYSHHAHVGHELKSRAWVNVIEANRFSNEADGDASREVDLPNGGTAYLIGNVIQQGPLGQNSNLVGYGLEGLTNPDPHELYAINNTLVNEKSVGSFFAVMNGADLFKAYSNILAGGGTTMAGAWPTTIDTLANLRATDIASVQFTDAFTYDYRIAIGSPADGGGFPAGLANSGYPLVAIYEYVHPADRILRCQQALLDVGAFETCTTTGLSGEATTDELRLFPNPTADMLTLLMPDAATGAVLQVFDVRGTISLPLVRMGDRYVVDVSALAPGLYHVWFGEGRSSHFVKL